MIIVIEDIDDGYGVTAQVYSAKSRITTFKTIDEVLEYIKYHMAKHEPNS